MTFDLLVVGAGYTGGAVAAFYAAKGSKVAGLVRSEESADKLTEHCIFPVIADLTRPETLTDIPSAKNILICPSSSGRSEENYRKIYLEGISNFLKTLDPASSPGSVHCVPQRLIYISSTGVYGERGGEWVDENTPPNPETGTGKILLEAEKQIIASGFPSIIFRVSGIYGPGRNRIESKRESKSERYTNMMHVEDIVRAVALLFEKGKPGEIYLGVDEEPVLLSQLYHFLRKNPDGLIKENQFLGKRCRNTKLKSLGFKFRYPTFREGYRPYL